jgi:hypothetical protein
MISNLNSNKRQNNNFFFNKNANKKFDINYGPTTHVALFANVRDEVHIKEWVAHHLLIGFDIIIIFDHKSIIPLKDSLSNFGEKVFVFRYDEDGPIKIPLMNRAMKMARKMMVDWFIYLDADEFIILNTKENNIKCLLNIYNHAHSLGINWLFFGSNNLIEEPKGLLIENYTKSSKILDKHVKCFVRPYEATFANNPHFYHIRNKNRMYGLNKRLSSSTEPFFCNSSFCIEYDKSSAYIAHYIYQSEESCINRKVKLPCDDVAANRNIQDVKFIHDLYNEEDNFYPKETYASNIKFFLQAYK